MFTQTDTTFVVVSQQAEDVINLGRRYHWRFRIIPDLQGAIDRPVYSSKGDWLYMPLRELDKPIIPKAAFRRHAAVQKAGIQVAQVIIGHEITVAPEKYKQPSGSPSLIKEIDWQKVAGVAGKGLLAAVGGIAFVSLYALTGALQLVDPSYCIVEKHSGSVIELIRWNTEVKHGTNSLES